MAKKKFSLMEEVQKTSVPQNHESNGGDMEAASKDMPDGMKASVKPEEIRATFIVPPVLIRKIKLIGSLENRKHKDIVGTALSEFVSRWEAAHPTVDLVMIDNLVK